MDTEKHLTDLLNTDNAWWGVDGLKRIVICPVCGALVPNGWYRGKSARELHSSWHLAQLTMATMVSDHQNKITLIRGGY